jgi:hypothetical protein
MMPGCARRLFQSLGFLETFCYYYLASFMEKKPMFIISRRVTMRNTLNLISGLMLFFMASITQASAEPAQAVQKTDADMNFRLDKVVEQPTKRTDSNSTADHTKFEDLKADFSSGPEVTKACLKCHEVSYRSRSPVHEKHTLDLDLREQEDRPDSG